MYPSLGTPGINHQTNEVRQKKVGRICASFHESMQIVSNQSIKCPDDAVKLMWANT